MSAKIFSFESRREIQIPEGAEMVLAVKNWEKFQQYKDRSPQWIKLHRALLTDYEFEKLADEAKAHLMLIWLLAAETGNQIPDDPAWIARKISATTTVDLPALIAAGFLVSRTDTTGVSVRDTQLHRTVQSEDPYIEQSRAEKRREEREQKREEQQQHARANGDAAAAAANNPFGGETHKSIHAFTSVEAYVLATKPHAKNPGGLARKIWRSGEEDKTITAWRLTQATARPIAPLSSQQIDESKHEFIALAESMGSEWLVKMKANFEAGGETASPVYQRICDLLNERIAA